MEANRNRKALEKKKFEYAQIRELTDYEIIRNLISPLDIASDKEDEVIRKILRALDGSAIDRYSFLSGKEEDQMLKNVLSSALEAGRRWPSRKLRQVRKPEDAYLEIRHYASRPQEQIIVIALNGAHEILFTEVVTIGTVSNTLAHPREIFANAILNRATGIILAHNHPSGCLKVSPEDASVTRRVIEAGLILGIAVLDHLIISQEGFISLKMKGLIP